MFKAFNSLQITALYAAYPFGLGWLWEEPFAFSIALFWVLAVAYIFFTALMTAAVWSSVDDL